jgi:hypothetical protein
MCLQHLWSVSSFLLPFSFFRGDHSPTATSAPSLRPACLERFPDKFPASPCYHNHPNFYFSLAVWVVGASTWPAPAVSVVFPYISEGVDPSTRSISSFFIMPQMIRLLASRFPVWGLSRHPYMMCVRSKDAVVLCLGPLFWFCLVASVLGLSPSCCCCILGLSKVSSQTCVLFEFLMLHCPQYILSWRCPSWAIPLLHGGMSFRRQRSLFFAIHNIPRSSPSASGSAPQPALDPAPLPQSSNWHYWGFSLGDLLMLLCGLHHSWIWHIALGSHQCDWLTMCQRGCFHAHLVMMGNI